MSINGWQFIILNHGIELDNIYAIVGSVLLPAYHVPS